MPAEASYVVPSENKRHFSETDMRDAIFRAVLFVVFFSIGAAGLTVAILYDDLTEYYRKRELLRIANVSLDRLRTLNTDYDALLSRVREDPNQVKRIAPATLGVAPADANAIYPKAHVEQLSAAKRALAKDLKTEPSEIQLPKWIVRVGRPLYRLTLFLSGMFLILISFVWFGPSKKASLEV